MKIGRPKIKDSEKKNEITGVRLREDERKSLEKAASAEGKTLSAWMRDAAVKRASKDEPNVVSGSLRSPLLLYFYAVDLGT